MKSQKPKLIDLISKYQLDSLHKEIIQLSQSKFSLKKYRLQGLSLSELNKMIQKMTELGNFSLDRDKEHEKNDPNAWNVNEFKLFLWFCLFIILVKSKELKNFEKPQLKELHEVFVCKSADFLQYHLRNLLHQSSKIKDAWKQQQTQLLRHIIQNCRQKLNWTNISISFFQKSKGRYFKTPQKCRQYWFNHLNPELKHEKWTLEQDYQLFKCVQLHGTKWAYIAKLFKHSRTEHMIKNRYNSLLKKYYLKPKKHSFKASFDFAFEQMRRKITLKGNENKINEGTDNEIEKNELESYSLMPQVIKIDDSWELYDSDGEKIPDKVGKTACEQYESWEKTLHDYKELIKVKKDNVFRYLQQGEDKEKISTDEYINQLLF